MNKEKLIKYLQKIVHSTTGVPSFAETRMRAIELLTQAVRLTSSEDVIKISVLHDPELT